MIRYRLICMGVFRDSIVKSNVSLAQEAECCSGDTNCFISDRKRFVRTSNCPLREAIFRLAHGMANIDRGPEMGREDSYVLTN